MNQTTLIIDFSTNLVSVTVEDETRVNSVISDITPNNYLAALAFLQDNNCTVLSDFIDEVDYSVADY